MKDVYTVHHKLMADVAVLLRTIARMENFHFPAIPKFLARYISNSALVIIVLKNTDVVPELLEASYFVWKC